MSKLEIKVNQVTEVPLGMLIPDPDQPRQSYAETPLQELADDIKLRNVREPIKIRLGEENKLIIVKGERRFRASQLALKTTIPCLLESDDSKDETPELTRQLGQVKENHLREPLNPMEWASFLKKLRDDHKIKVADMEVFLKNNAIHNMSRSYISNLIRLVDLPEWAQKLISEGKLTAAHGKHILTAKISDEAMEEVKAAIDNIIKEGELETFTVSDLEDEVVSAFRTTAIELNGSKFNVDTVCNKCTKKKKFATNWGGWNFCLDEECYKSNQAKVAEQKTSERRTDKTAQPEEEKRKPVTKAKANKKGIVELDKHKDIDGDDDIRLIENAEFNTDACAKCKNNKQASGSELDYLLGEDEGSKVVKQVCFDVACYEDKWFLEEEEQEKIAPFVKYLSTALRNHIAVRHLPNNEELQLNLLGFMAMGWPIELRGVSDGFVSDDEMRVAHENISEDLKMTNLKAVLEKDAMNGIVVIARDGVMRMGLQSLAMLAQHLKVGFEDFFKMDKKLLELFTKEELIAWGELKNKDIANSAAWSKAIKGEADDLYPFFKDSDLTGEDIPRSITLAWKKFIAQEVTW